MLQLELGMLYYVFPMQGGIPQSVIDKFTSTYLNGGTPNPCIDCNRFLKFDALVKKARRAGYGLYCQAVTMRGSIKVWIQEDIF